MNTPNTLIKIISDREFGESFVFYHYDPFLLIGKQIV